MLRQLLRALGLGKFPSRERIALLAEGIRVLDEGVTGWLHYRDVRGPGRRHIGKYRGFIGAVALTDQRIVAYAFALRVLDLELDDPRLAEIECWLDDAARLHLACDAAIFDETWSGPMEYRYDTAHAAEIRDGLLDHGAMPRGATGSSA